MKNEPQPDSDLILYQTEDGWTRLQVRLEGETVWLSPNQMADLFQRNKSVISRHIKNEFAEGKLTRDSVVAESATTAADGKTYQVEFLQTGSHHLGGLPGELAAGHAAAAGIPREWFHDG